MPEMPKPMEPVLRLRKTRGVADVLNDTFRFLRQNYAPVGKSLLLIAGPATVLSAVSGSMMQILTFGFQPAQSEALAASLGLSFLGAVVLGIVAAVLTATVSTSAVMLYQERGPGGFDVRDVWARTKAYFWRIMLGFLLLFFMILAGFLVLLIPCLGAVGYLVGFVHFGVVFSIYLPMLMRERVGYLAGLRRCRMLMRGYWWPSFGVVLVAFIIYLLLGMWANVPYYTVLFLSGWHGLEGGGVGAGYSLALVTASIVAALVGTLLYSILYTAVTLHYFNLVERKERVGLRRRVEALGPPARPGPEVTDG